MDFIAVDVETANPDLASICQIGLITFKNGKAVNSWQSLVNPEDYFDGMNIAIHGINEHMVKKSPTFPQIFSILQNTMSSRIVVSHMPFDRVALTRVAEKYSLNNIECTWLDTAKVVRRAWSEFAHRGYGLANIAENFGIEFKHHNAEDDARVAGEILVKAIADTGLSIDDWLERVQHRLTPSRSYKIVRDGNSEGPLHGEVVLFTGALSIPRREAADLAANAGCEVVASVKNTVTLLVVGDQDVTKLAGHKKSSKHRKAEELIAKGQKIRILKESDFSHLIGLK